MGSIESRKQTPIILPKKEFNKLQFDVFPNKLFVCVCIYILSKLVCYFESLLSRIFNYWTLFLIYINYFKLNIKAHVF